MKLRFFSKTLFKILRNEMAPKKRFMSGFECKNNEITSDIVIQVIGTGASGTSKSLTVLTNHRNYLFNCGEGTTRLLKEHGIGDVNDCFITHPSLNNTSGLPGIRNLTLHGPPKIRNLFTFVFTKGSSTKINVCDDFSTVIQDGDFRIESVPIIAKKNVLSRSVNEETSNLSFPSSKNKKKKGGITVEEKMDVRDISLAYICVPSTLSEIGKCGDVKSGEVFIVIECPTEDFLDSLLETETFSKFQLSNNNPKEMLSLMVHLTPTDVFNHWKYKDWMSRFPSETKHMIVNESCPGLANEAVYRLQYKLNCIDPEVFPLLKTDFELPQSCVDSRNVILAEPLLRYFIRPKSGCDRSKIVKLEPDKYLNEVANIPGWQKNYLSLKTSVAERETSVESDTDYPQVIFLGTGSYLSTVMRNVCCILLKINKDKCMILDCGEGSYGQILRYFGSQETAKILINLTAIFISHLHFDHFGGLVKILHERQKIMEQTDPFERPLFLLAPPHIDKYLKLHDNISPINLISNFQLCYGQRQMMNNQYQTILHHSDLLDICTVKVKHNIIAFGVVLTLKDGQKLVYTGDTTPCDDLIEIGKNCNLLIHEATMCDFETQPSHAKYHSTVSQAIEMGRRMDVEFTMLTHFGTQHGPVPIFSDDCLNVGVAFDNMMVPLSRLHLTSAFTPVFELLFRDYDKTL
uniref:ribonuclease Z n=1 Tax=Strigamia maritima TaxID=126957 RepID=T1JGB1_STRMM